MIASSFSLDQSSENELISFLDELAASNPSVLGYHYPLYLKMLEAIGLGKLHLIVVRDDKGKITAFIPGLLKTNTIGSVYSSMPFFGPNAGVIYDRNHPHKTQIITSAVEGLFKTLEGVQLISASIYSPFEDEFSKDLYAKLLPDSEVVEKFTSFIRLDELELSSSLLYDLRKAEKSGVVIKAGNFEGCSTLIYEMYKKNCEDYGIPLKPFEAIDYLVKNSSEKATTNTYTAWLNDQMIGALIMVYSPTTASYYLPCSLHEYRSFQPTSLLIKYAMDRSIERGLKFWNWEASPSKESGVFKFKKKWGSLDGTYRIFIKPFQPREFFSELGQTAISSEFPFFFVFPFNRL